MIDDNRMNTCVDEDDICKEEDDTCYDEEEKRGCCICCQIIIVKNKCCCAVCCCLLIVILVLLILAFRVAGPNINPCYVLHTTYNYNTKKTDIKKVIDVKNSPFNASYPTRFLIHQWHGGKESPFNLQVVKAYQEKGHFNVFVVDWSSLASKPYTIATLYLKKMANNIGDFIKQCEKEVNLKLENTYIIGFGMGAHLAGMTGRRCGKVNTIFGLDPVKKLFKIHKLKRSDAYYVEVIHTSLSYGARYPLGTADFYPNFGCKQPQCPPRQFECSHNRAYEYFAHSINYPENYEAKKCDSFLEILRRKPCTQNTDIFMGDEPSNAGRAEGVYYVGISEHWLDECRSAKHKSNAGGGADATTKAADADGIRKRI